jgi:hypothetical protein
MMQVESSRLWTPRSRKSRRVELAPPIGFGLPQDPAPVLFGGITNPTAIPNCVWWLRPDLLLTQVANRVSAWGDSSGFGDANRNAAQATGAKQPLYSASQALVNNQPTIKNDDAARFLATGVWANSYTQPTTMFCVGVAMNNRLVDGSSLSANRNAFINSGNNVGYYSGTGIVAGSVSCVSAFAACGIFNGASSSLYVNSSAATTATGNPGTNPYGAGGAGILGTADGAGLSAGDEVAEIAFFSRALTTVEIHSLFAYAGARYGKAWS